MKNDISRTCQLKRNPLIRIEKQFVKSFNTIVITHRGVIDWCIWCNRRYDWESHSHQSELNIFLWLVRSGICHIYILHVCMQTRLGFPAWKWRSRRWLQPSTPVRNKPYFILIVCFCYFLKIYARLWLSFAVICICFQYVISLKFERNADLHFFVDIVILFFTNKH